MESKDEVRPEFASGSLQLTTYGDNGDHSVAGSILLMENYELLVLINILLMYRQVDTCWLQGTGTCWYW